MSKPAVVVPSLIAACVLALSASPLTIEAEAATSRPFVVAAGDIACAEGLQRTASRCHEDATAALLAGGGPLSGAGLRAIVTLGDHQYPDNRLSAYTYQDPDCDPAPPFGTAACSFDATWGAAKRSTGARWRPTPGNHEYNDPDGVDTPCLLQETAPVAQNACGYNRYFGNAVAVPDEAHGGDRPGGDYAFRFNPNAAHPMWFVSLNVGQCDRDRDRCRAGAPGGPVEFLTQTLADIPPAACVVAYWHQPAWSYYGHRNDRKVLPVWRALFDVTGAREPDLVVNGHSHNYQRFTPLDASGAAGSEDAAIPQIVVGTGGEEHDAGVAANPDPSVPGPPTVANLTDFGVLKLSWSPGAGSITTSFFAEGEASPDGGVDTHTYVCN
jgi:hypothetical protein